ncbi:glycosyl hydrolase family 18 protein [Vagococcus sp. PNs007]|uniref:chitinase n=1 Tax=Vagococcus proximus TaxID=2991417 RepID=A0ABT5WZZ8_9ENTE|nr:glycosyl hydrolase family 18 protein [Vagococcus proximus]MDF0479232.1 glycosyl hydrolase family 18 protein [Vagococcus proximus]
MKNNRILMIGLLVIVAMTSLLGFGQTSQAERAKFKTVGYLPDYDVGHIDDTVDFTQFTDVNFFSMVPQNNGELKFSDTGSASQLKEFVTKAHKHRVRAGVSIGGWNLSDNFVQATSKENLATFVKNIAKLVDKYELDTIDIDWEYPDVSEAAQFESFMKALKKELSPREVKISICVPSGIGSTGDITGKWEDNFTPEALNTADWVNIMAYDAQVPGEVSHSPVDLQANSLKYWNKLMGGDKMSHLIAGVPYYAKSNIGTVMTYNRILNIAQDKIKGDKITYNGAEYHFNNKKTIKEKTEASIELKSLGIMIWTPTQDADLTSSNRLTDVIVNTIEKDKRVTLDKGRVIFGKVAVNPPKIYKVPVKLLTNLVCVALALVGVLFFRGGFNEYVPDISIKGKKIRSVKFAKIIGASLLVIALTGLILINLPWYMILLIVLAILGGIYYIFFT